MITQIKRADGTYMSGIKSCTFSEIVNAEHNLMPGCVASAHIEVEVYGSASAAPAVGEALTYYQVQGDNSPVQIGIFYAEKAEAGNMSYKFSAYDAAAKLDTDFSTRLAELQSSFPMTRAALLAEVATVSGVTFGTGFDGSTLVNAFYADGITCRQIVSWYAQLQGYFVKCNENGALEKRRFNSPSYSIAPYSDPTQNIVAYKQGGFEHANYVVDRDIAVAVHAVGNESQFFIFPRDYTRNNIAHVYGNMLLTGQAGPTYQGVALTIQNFLSGGLTEGDWTPGIVHLFPDENPFRAGDRITVTDTQGNTFIMFVLSMTVNEIEAVLSYEVNETYTEQTTTDTKNTQTTLSADIVQLKHTSASQQEQIDAVSAWQNWSHRNLLDNWYFGAGVINQRLKTAPSIGSGQYFGIDRWPRRSGSMTETVTDDGVTFAASSSGSATVCQYIGIDQAKALYGKKVTYSILFYSGENTDTLTLATGSETVPTTLPTQPSPVINLNEQVPHASFTRLAIVADGRLMAQFGQTAGHSIKVKAVKLEIGDTQTLAHQEGGAWVLNELPNQGIELLKCQRYFQVFRTQALRPTYAEDFRPVMASNPTLGSFTVNGVTYYTASAETTT